MKKRIITLALALMMCLSLMPSTAFAAFQLVMPSEDIVIPDKLGSATIYLPGSNVEMTVTNILPVAKLSLSSPDDDNPVLMLFSVGTTNVTFNADIECQEFGDTYIFDENGTLCGVGGGANYPALLSKGLTKALSPSGWEVPGISIPGSKALEAVLNGRAAYDDGELHQFNVQYNFTHTVDIVCIPNNEILIRYYLELANYDYQDELWCYDVEYDFQSLLSAGTPVSDVPSSWAAEQVSAAVAVGLVPENLQKNYTSPVSRGSVAQMFINLVEQTAGQSIDDFLVSRNVAIRGGTFTDTDDKSVLIANALGLISGVGDSKFDPDGTLTRAQIAAIINRYAILFGVNTEGYGHGFTDVDSHWVSSELGWPVHAGIVSGVGDNKYDPDGKLTTEQAIAITYRALQSIQ